MKSVINARELRAHLSEVVDMAGKGERLHRFCDYEGIAHSQGTDAGQTFPADEF